MFHVKHLLPAARRCDPHPLAAMRHRVAGTMTMTGAPMVRPSCTRCAATVVRVLGPLRTGLWACSNDARSKRLGPARAVVTTRAFYSATSVGVPTRAWRLLCPARHGG